MNFLLNFPVLFGATLAFSRRNAWLLVAVMTLLDIVRSYVNIDKIAWPFVISGLGGSIFGVLAGSWALLVLHTYTQSLKAKDLSSALPDQPPDLRPEPQERTPDEQQPKIKSRLQLLKELHQAGDITDAEYESKRAKILSDL